MVPAAIVPGAAARIHLVFRPNLEIDAHWNNEAEDLVFWIDPPTGWRVDRRASSVPNPPQPVSEEVRRLELEVRSPEGWSGIAVLSGYALYYVCEGVEGTCLYRRQDVELRLEAASP